MSMLCVGFKSAREDLKVVGKLLLLNKSDMHERKLIYLFLIPYHKLFNEILHWIEIPSGYILFKVTYFLFSPV